MNSGYPDSGYSSLRPRETDSDQRWGARGLSSGCRFRLMCSSGCKIQQRSYDNQLSYVGTHILVVSRRIKFASMKAKLSNEWGTAVSFKYQLPNEDLNALVSVTNDEDMENMMAEYDRLQKMGCRFSMMRLFVFPKKPNGSSQSSLGPLMEKRKQEGSPDSSPIPGIRVLKTSDRRENSDIQSQKQYRLEFAEASSSLIKVPAPLQPELQVRIQEFQKPQLRQSPDPIGPNLNIPGRRICSNPVRAVNLSSQDMARPSPINQVYIPPQKEILQNPSPPEFYMHDPGSHFVLQSCWQMKEPHGDQQYQTLYFMHAGSSKLQQPMSAVGPMGQPVPGSRGYYNPLQKMTGPVQVYSPEAAPLSNSMAIVRAGADVQRQNGLNPTEPHRTPTKSPNPVSKLPWKPIPIDKRIVYKPTAPIPLADTEPYSNQNFVYEQSPRQIYYMEATPAMNPQYQLMNLDMEYRQISCLSFRNALAEVGIGKS